MAHDDQPQPQGQIRALRNKVYDPKGILPHFAGQLALPSSQTRQISLWARNDKNGRSYILGRVHPPMHTIMERLAAGENASPSRITSSEIPSDFEALNPKPGEMILLEYECSGCAVHHYKGYLNNGAGHVHAVSLDTNVLADGELFLTADVIPCDDKEMTAWSQRTNAAPPGDDDDDDEEPQRKRGRGR